MGVRVGNKTVNTIWSVIVSPLSPEFVIYSSSTLPHSIRTKCSRSHILCQPTGVFKLKVTQLCPARNNCPKLNSGVCHGIRSLIYYYIDSFGERVDGRRVGEARSRFDSHCFVALSSPPQPFPPNHLHLLSRHPTQLLHRATISRDTSS